MTFAELCDLADVSGWKVRVTGPTGRKVGDPLMQLWVVKRGPESPDGEALDAGFSCDLRCLSLDEAADRIFESMRELGAIK